MVNRDSAWSPGTPCWVDLSVDDVDKAVAFYSGLLGWEVTIDPAPEYGGHGNFTKDGRDVAGVSPTMESGQPQVWTTFLATDDLEQTAGKIRGGGGQVIVDVTEIGAHGRMIVAVDAAGAVFGVWQSGTHTGMRLANEPGAVTWNENLSRDFDANTKFYAEVFGFDYADMSMDGFTYATFELNGASVGGIGQLPDDTPAEVPANWTTYFAVRDTDAAVAKIRELGGSLVKEPFDTPQGRIALVADNQGAHFAVISV